MDKRKLIKIFEQKGLDDMMWEAVHGRVELQQINKAFRHATKEGHEQMALRLLPLVDGNNKAMGVREAATYGHIQLLNTLLTHQFDLAPKLLTHAFEEAVEYAAHAGQWESVLMLIKHAPYGDHEETIQKLIRHNNAHNSIGLLLEKSHLTKPELLLTNAAQYSTPEVCEMFLPLCSNEHKQQAFWLALMALNKSTSLFLLDEHTLRHAKQEAFPDHFMTNRHKDKVDALLGEVEAEWTRRVLTNQVQGGQERAARKM